jgi:hypothetical protein
MEKPVSGLPVASIVVVVIAVVIYLLRRGERAESKKPPEPQAYAKAVAAEKRRRRGGARDASPLPAGEYDLWGDQSSLIDPVILPRDSQLRDLCRTYRTTDDKARARMRGAISTEEFYKLIGFSMRAAVFAMRDEGDDWLITGLSAVAMIEVERIDYTRDLSPPLSLLYHSARRTGIDPGPLFQSAASLAEPAVERLLLEFPAPTAEAKDIRSAGWDEIVKDGRRGFVPWLFKPYDPTYDMTAIAMDIAGLLAADRYHPIVSIAEALAPYWLQENEQDQAAKNVLTDVRAGAQVYGLLRPGEHPSNDSQELQVFIVETNAVETGQTLLGMSQRPGKAHHGHPMLGVWKGKVFCLLIGRSSERVEPFETSESLQRFSKGLSDILSKHTVAG